MKILTRPMLQLVATPIDNSLVESVFLLATTWVVRKGVWVVRKGVPTQGGSAVRLRCLW